jgi:hypothetical protein
MDFLGSIGVLAPILDAWRRLVTTAPFDDIEFKPDLSFLEQNTHILYPLFAIGTVALLGMGIFLAWRSDEMSAVLKAEYKREVMIQLRRQPSGLTVAKLAKVLQLSVHKTAQLVEEMANDRQVRAQENNGVTLVQLRF